VERTIRVFRSFAEADQAEIDFYHSLTPQQRLEILFELVARTHPDEIEQRSERVIALQSSTREQPTATRRERSSAENEQQGGE
jgi:hypothetical protein